MVIYSDVHKERPGFFHIFSFILTRLLAKFGIVIQRESSRAAHYVPFCLPATKQPGGRQSNCTGYAQDTKVLSDASP
jgi:hypothetical protein